MKGFSRFSAIASLLFTSTLCVPGQLQQLPFDYAVIHSADPVRVGDTLTLTLLVTNRVGEPFDLFVTNTFSSAVTVQSATNNYGNVQTVTSSNVIFTVPQLSLGFPANLTIRLRPQVAGILTNFVTVVAPQASLSFSNSFLQITTLVTNAPAVSIDLAVFSTGPPLGALINDLLPYTVTVTNLGANTVTNVVLTNIIPASVTIAPGSATTTLVSSPFTLTNRASRVFRFTLQPTNAGTFLLSASAGAAGSADSNTNNNAAVVPLVVQALTTGQLIATNLTAMTFNPQQSLMEQTIRLVNVSTSSVASARVIVRGLTTNRLYNAVGTNAPVSGQADPFVMNAAPLDPGQSADLILEYVITNRIPVLIDNSNYVAVAMPAVNVAAPSGTNGTFAITLQTNLPDGRFLIEFQSTPGASYTIRYSTNGTSFSNPLSAQPPVVAQADKTLWIDDGPPKTISFPTNAAARFYRVLRNP